MKTLKFLSLIAVAFLFAACSGDKAASVAAKIDAGQKLSQSDYTTIVDYCGDFAKEAQKFQNQIDALPDSAAAVSVDETKLADLKLKFPLLEKFNTALLASTPEEVGEDNVKKVNDLAKYIWFTAPDWATIQTDPNVAGFIEDTPAAGTDSGVIAGGDGEVVAK
ncbi:MAG: hypothetical protein HDS73_02525 [Bacteroidales bacterium]|nr:hypothetical protein [Bacteroidales bacterium]